MTDSWNNLQDFSDDAIRHFLFGRLGPTAQAKFEERLFTDDDLEARVHLAEIELSDDYALARLSVADREAFEQRFLLTADRKRILSVSTALRERFASTSTAAIPLTKRSSGKRLRLLFGLKQRRWQFAFGVAVIAVLVAAVWLAMREARDQLEAYRPPPVVRSSPTPSSRREAGHRDGAASPAEHQTTPSPMPPHEPPPPAIVTAALFPGTSRDDDNLPRVVLPKGEHGILRLQLALKPNQAGVYRAELLTGGNQNIFTGESLESTDADKGKIDFDVPARLLKPGDYQIRLGRPANETARGETKYYFHILP